jgi:hypothetical protein
VQYFVGDDINNPPLFYFLHKKDIQFTMRIISIVSTLLALPLLGEAFAPSLRTSAVTTVRATSKYSSLYGVSTPFAAKTSALRMVSSARASTI